MNLPPGAAPTPQAPEPGSIQSNPAGILPNVSGHASQPHLRCLGEPMSAAPSQPAAAQEGVLYGNGAVLSQAAVPLLVRGQHEFLSGQDTDLSQQLSQLRLDQQQQRQQGNASEQQLQQQLGCIDQDAGSPSGAPNPVTEQLHQDHSRAQSSGANSTHSACHGGVQVLDGPADWVWFHGEWGTTQAPIAQGWFHTAETPVSRSAWLRVLVQAWPETQRI